MRGAIEIDHTREITLEFFRGYVERNKELLRTKTIYDLSAGRGYIAHLFEQTGARVIAFDLYPEQNRFFSGPVNKIDLQQPFPVETASADVALCCETIEHLPNQFFFFSETARILKPGGRLILTTPNTSSLRSRLSQFLMESEHYSAAAPNETNAFTKWENSRNGYFGKLFLSGILRLRTLAALNHLRLHGVHPTQRSSTSRWLMVCYPMLYYFNRKVMRSQIKKDPENEPVFRNIFKLNTSLDILLGKHLILEFSRDERQL
jgi:SAM-dependent methyltransferase